MAERQPWITHYLPNMIREGLSGAEMLRRLRASTRGVAEPMPIREQTFYRALGETRAALASREAVQAEPLHRRPSRDVIVEYTSRKATGFLYSFDVLVRNRQTGEVYYTPSGFRSDRLVKWSTALHGATSALVESEEKYGLVVLGALQGEVREYVPGLDE